MYTDGELDLFISIAGSVPSGGFNIQFTYMDGGIEETNISSSILITPASRLAWDQDADSLSAVQELSAKVYVDGSSGYTPVPQTSITCTGNQAPFLCSMAFPAIPLVTGVHTLNITVYNNAGESAHSNNVSFTVAIFATPRNLRLVQ